MYLFVGRQACPEDVAIVLATCSGQVQHTRSLTLNMIAVKVGALQQDRCVNWGRQQTLQPRQKRKHKRLLDSL